MHQLKKNQKLLFSPTRLCEGMKDGCEMIVHLVKSLIDIYSSYTNKSLLKIDFKNTFNLISSESIIIMSIDKLIFNNNNIYSFKFHIYILNTIQIADTNGPSRSHRLVHVIHNCNKEPRTIQNK